MQTRLLTTGVVPEIESLRIRVRSLIWEGASRNPYSKECVDVCIMNKSDVAPHEQQSPGRVGLRAKWHLLRKWPSPLIPVFGRKSHRKSCCPSAHACSHFAFTGGRQDTNREQMGNGWHKCHPWSCWVFSVSPANVSPFLVSCSVAWACLWGGSSRQCSAACLPAMGSASPK